MMERNGFVTVKQASLILDVAPNTIRAWGATGKITEFRDPANSYRLYKRDELDRILVEASRPIVLSDFKRKAK